MNICMVSASASRLAGGLFVSVRNLAQKIAASAHVDMLALRDEHAAADRSCWHPIEPQLFDRLGPAVYGYSPVLRKAMQACGADVLHAHGIWMYPCQAAGQVARETGKPLILSPRGMLDPWALRASSWKKKVASLLYGQRTLAAADCIHALCESEYRSIRAYGLTNPVAIVPNGIDLPERNDTLTAPWADVIAPDERVLLFLGRISPKKNLHGLIDAWHKVSQEQPANGWVLAIAGWSRENARDYERAMRQKVTDLQLERSVHFIGPLHDERKQAALQQAEAFILPSHSEGFPMAILEAWAYGLPVVMTPQCNIPEGFAAGAALEIETNVESTAKGLDVLTKMSEEQRRQMGRAGRQLVEAQFTWQSIASEMLGVYEWLLGQKEKPACVRLN